MKDFLFGKKPVLANPVVSHCVETFTQLRQLQMDAVALPSVCKPVPGFLAGDRSMSSSLSASQLHTVNMRDPLNRVLGKKPPVPRSRFLLVTDTRAKTPSSPYRDSVCSQCVSLRVFSISKSTFAVPHIISRSQEPNV